MLEIALSIGYISIALFLIGKLPLFTQSGIRLNVFRGLFLVKILAAIALYLIYTRFYPERKYADIFKYYDDSAVIYNTAFSNPWAFFRMLTGFHGGDHDLSDYYNTMHNWFNSVMVFNDSRTMIRFNVILRFISFGTYFPHAVILSFLGFLGLAGIFRIMRSALPDRETILLVIVFLMPSTLLWTSGMIKEAFLIFSLGLLLYSIGRWLEERKWPLKRIVGIVFFSFCLLNIKSYILFVALPGIVAWIVTYEQRKFRWLSVIGIHLVYIAAVFVFSEQITGERVAEVLSSKQREFYMLAQRENAKSMIELPSLAPSNESLMENMFPGFITTFLRPHLLEAGNVLMLVAALENVLMFVFLFICLAGFRLKSLASLTPLFFFALFFSFLMYCMIGMVTPILGSVVRYKVPALPFLLFTFLSLNSAQRLQFSSVNASLRS